MITSSLKPIQSLLVSSDFLGKTRSEERVLSYLPLSHIAGMMLDGVVPLTIGVYTKGWCSVNFARPYDLKASTIGDRLKAVRPTVFFGVPRVWEKIQEKLLAVGAALPDGLKKKLAAKAKKRSLFFQEGQQLGGHGKKPGSLAIYNILLKKIKGKTRIGQVQIYVCRGCSNDDCMFVILWFHWYQCK